MNVEGREGGLKGDGDTAEMIGEMSGTPEIEGKVAIVVDVYGNVTVSSP